MFSMTGFVDEMVKIGQYAQTAHALKGLESIVPMLRGAGKWAIEKRKPLALIGLGGGGVLGAQRLGEDVMMAERIRAMQRG